MAATLATNPYGTTVATGMFNVSSSGVTQGTAFPDPATRFQLRSGWVSNSETIPMWGGIAVTELISQPTGTPPTGPLASLGVQLKRATTVSSTNPINGFTVFDQSYNAVTTTSNTVPLVPSYGTINTYRIGSGARIAVACDPALVSIIGDPITVPSLVTWDFVNQQLVPYTGSINVSSGTYNSTTGLVTLVIASNPGISPGDTVIVAGLTGSGSFAAANGTFTAGAGTTGTTLTYTIATGLTLTISNTGTVTTGATALTVSVLQVFASGCQTVTYASSTASWNWNGSAAVIQI